MTLSVLFIVGGVILVLGIAFLSMRAFMSPMIVIRPSVVSSVSKFLGHSSHDAAKIYTKKDRYEKSDVVIPFSRVVADHLEAMAIIHFVEKKGEHYLGFEAQHYAVPGGELLQRVLAFTEKRKDADVYIPRGKRSLDDATYRVDHPVDEVRDTLEADFERFDLSAKDTGLLVDVAFADRFDRHIELHVDEQRLGKAAVFKSILAPASLLSHADYFPLLILSEMSIAHRKSHVSAKVDGQETPLSRIPMLGTRLIIYGHDPVGYYLFLKTKDEPASVHSVAKEQSVLELRNINCEVGHEEVIAEGDEVVATYDIKNNAGFSEIASVTYMSGQDKLVIEFMPPIPSLIHLREGTSVAGRFAISTPSTPGLMIGTYGVEGASSRATLTLEPKKAYQPVSGDLWVRAYRWISELDFKDATPRLDTHWEKKKIINDGLHIKVVD